MAQDPKSRFNNERYKASTIGEDEANPTRSSMFPATDGLANNAEAVISFQHVPSGNDIYFKAFITTFSDTLSPEYTAETVFGRTDPIYTFRNTTRNISLNWKVPAASISEAYENLGKAQKLAQFVYPDYADIGNALTISQTPLVRLKVMNLLTKNGQNTEVSNAASDGNAGNSPTNKLKTYKSNSDSSNGALGVIKSITILHNIETFEAGVIQTAPNTVLPKLIEINISFDVIHEDTLGWKNKNFSKKGFPYDVSLEEEVSRDALDALQTFEQRQEQARNEAELREDREQDIANSKARYSTAGGLARFRKDKNRIERLQNKENRSAAQDERLDYLNSTVRGQNYINEAGKKSDPDFMEAAINADIQSVIDSDFT
jgi:hypothetical protein